MLEDMRASLLLLISLVLSHSSDSPLATLHVAAVLIMAFLANSSPGVVHVVAANFAYSPTARFPPWRTSVVSATVRTSTRTVRPFFYRSSEAALIYILGAPFHRHFAPYATLLPHLDVAFQHLRRVHYNHNRRDFIRQFERMTPQAIIDWLQIHEDDPYYHPDVERLAFQVLNSRGLGRDPDLAPAIALLGLSDRSSAPTPSTSHN